MKDGCIVRADALSFARSLPAETITLAYLDPPFGVGRDHHLLKGRLRPSAQDVARDSVAYRDPKAQQGELQEWILDLCREIHRLLTPTGSFFLHLDWRTVHRAKVFLDEVFGAAAFRNEIIWRYATGGIPRDAFARKHDTLLYYARGPKPTFHRQQEKKYLAHRMSRRGVPEYRDERGWYRFRYLDDVWDIPWITQDAKERTGYPTQKPLALLERIIVATTDAGDLVADFCCGSGTTAVAAERLGRRWLCSDLSPLAVSISASRVGRPDRHPQRESRSAQLEFPSRGPS